ncbi:MAG: hypothetical protein L0271_05610 [Gemmatimonadetes bacterium]|nr:hypothetical protein [Gemmatimonadota bacterium]
MRLPARIAFCLLGLAAPAAAQQDTTRLPPGVMLETRYSKAGRQVVAVRPFEAPAPIADVARQSTDIIRNDLTLSDRFVILPVPAELAAGPIEYRSWNGLNVVWLVTGVLQPTAAGYQLEIVLHDVVYGTTRQTRTLSLPEATSRDFRLAVHVASDEIVTWITNQPGMAATRIAFVRRNLRADSTYTYDLMLVDSDGENLRRISGSPGLIYSPTWSPDGTKLAYTVQSEDGWRLIERDMATGATRTVHSADGETKILTPTYVPGALRMAFASWVGRGFQVHDIDAAQGCCIRGLTSGGGDNISPTYAADGRRFAFHSTRTGRQHIFAAAADGSGAVAITPFGESVEYASPDFQPTGSRVAFHGASRGTFQIMVADAARPGGQIQQLTSSGRNEDPSWAADGRHIVYTSQPRLGAGAASLYVIDTVTGEIRLLVSGGNGEGLRLADWSPSLAKTLALVQKP